MAHDFEQRLKDVLAARTPQRLDQHDARDAAVLIPIVAEPEPTLIFTVRTESLPSHKGQISFPGGSVDATDPSPEVASLREAQEELSLDPNQVRVLGELDTFPTFVSGFVVTPFVGWLDSRPALKPNPREVAEILFVPLAELTDDIRREPGFSFGRRVYPTEAWVWNDHIIWGVTARIVRGFLGLLAEAGLAQPPGPTDSWTGWPIDPGA